MKNIGRTLIVLLSGGLISSALSGCAFDKNSKPTEDVFFVDNTTFKEPFRSANSALDPKKLSKQLKQEKFFDGMHDIVEGDRWMIGIRRFETSDMVGHMHGGYREDITLLMPKNSEIAQKEGIFQVPQVLVYYSGGGRFVKYAIAETGTVHIYPLNAEHIKIVLDLGFKRLRNGKDWEDDGFELLEDRGYSVDAPSDYGSFTLKKSYVAKKLAFKELDSLQRGWMTKEEIKNLDPLECFAIEC